MKVFLCVTDSVCIQIVVLYLQLGRREIDTSWVTKGDMQNKTVRIWVPVKKNNAEQTVLPFFPIKGNKPQWP